MLSKLEQNINGGLEWFKTYFFPLLLIVNISYFFLLFGISIISPKYLDTMRWFVHVFICVFLLIRFNPLRPMQELKKGDSNIIFASAVILLFNEGFVKYIDPRNISYTVTKFFINGSSSS